MFGVFFRYLFEKKVAPKTFNRKVFIVLHSALGLYWQKA